MHRETQAVVLLALIAASGAIPIDNGVVGSSVQCSADSIKVVFETRNVFQGRIFVKGNVEKDECKHSYTDDVASQSKNPEISFMFGECNMQRERRLAPQKGMMQSIVVIISFHRIFLTKVDRAYKIQCFYMEAEKVLTASLDVSMLTTANLEDTAGMPVCKYTVRSGAKDGPETKYATIGSAIYHQWECESTTHGILVKNCVVDNGKDEKHNIIDDRGCAIDPVIMPDLTYETGTALAFVESHAFKYADQPTVFFQCVVQLCNKGEPECDSLTPPKCTPGSAYTRSPAAGNGLAVGETTGSGAAGQAEGAVETTGSEALGHGESEGQTGTPAAGEEQTTGEASTGETTTGEGLTSESPTDAELTTAAAAASSAKARFFGFRRKNFQYRAKRNASVLTGQVRSTIASRDYSDSEVDLTSNSFVVLDLEDAPFDDLEHLSERSRIHAASDLLPDFTGGGDTRVCLSPSGFGILLTMVTTVFVVSASVAVCFCLGKFRVEDMKIA